MRFAIWVNTILDFIPNCAYIVACAKKTCPSGTPQPGSLIFHSLFSTNESGRRIGWEKRRESMKCVEYRAIYMIDGVFNSSYCQPEV